jgi:hypothetical protein
MSVRSSIHMLANEVEEVMEEDGCVRAINQSTSSSMMKKNVLKMRILARHGVRLDGGVDHFDHGSHGMCPCHVVRFKA